MNDPIRLIIADDHAMFRAGLKSLLKRQRDIRVVGEVETAANLGQTLAGTESDILLLDLQMDRWVLDDIPEFAQITKVIVLTASERGQDAILSMRSGASAVVQKRFAVDTLMEAIRAVASGFAWMPPAIQAEMAAQWSASSKTQLTKREAEVVACVAAGLRNAEIGERLDISETTVKTHMSNIFQKLKLRDRVELALYAHEHGLARNIDRDGNGELA
jgi:two-component system, NarL family, nitrate/nitrite response regulator NarL